MGELLKIFCGVLWCGVVESGVLESGVVVRMVWLWRVKSGENIPECT